MINDNQLALENIGGFLEKLAEKSDIVYWLSSPDFKKIQYISPAYEEIWGRPREILYREPELWITYLYPDDIKDHNPIHAMAERIAKEGPMARYDESYRIIRPDGEIRWIIDRGFPIYDNGGKCCGVTGVAVDITEKKRAEENFQRIEHQLKGMTIVTATIAHELRTPLAAIKSAAKGIEQIVPYLVSAYEKAVEHQLEIKRISPERIKLLEGIITNLEKRADQSNMVIDMLLANIKDRSTDLTDFESCSAITCIQKAISQYAFSDENLNITLKNSEDFIFYGKEILIIHVFFNLFKNALYFIKKARKGAITIWIEKAEQCNEIHFKDTAVGVPEEYLPKIFDEFYTFGTNKGTGVGLPFCKKTMQSIGGDITCKSVYGEYAEFILSFPNQINEKAQ